MLVVIVVVSRKEWSNTLNGGVLHVGLFWVCSG